MAELEEYEYWVTVDSVDVPRIVTALGGQPGDDVLALVETHSQAIIRTGEKTWISSLGIQAGFSSWAH